MQYIINIFKIGWIEYPKHIDMGVTIEQINNSLNVVIVRNEINYFSYAHFDDSSKFYTHINYIKSSSFAFEGLIEKSASMAKIADNISLHACSDRLTSKSMRINDGFWDKMRAFERNSIEFFE